MDAVEGPETLTESETELDWVPQGMDMGLDPYAMSTQIDWMGTLAIPWDEHPASRAQHPSTMLRRIARETGGC